MSVERFTFFYGGFMSQWVPSDFTVGGVKYCNAEQYMMASKARTFGNQWRLGRIMATRDPHGMKMIHGRSVRDFVFRGNVAKFSQNPDFLDLLYGTIGTTIVEASPTDTIWGIGLSEYDDDIHDRNNWRGTNWLGEVLMEVRDSLCK